MTHLSHNPGHGTANKFMVNSISAGDHCRYSPEAHTDRDLFNSGQFGLLPVTKQCFNMYILNISGVLRNMKYFNEIYKCMHLIKILVESSDEYLII